MRAWRKRRRVTTTGDVAVTVVTETVVATISGISTQSADSVVFLDGWVQVAAAAATTAATLRLRRGTTTSGTLLGEANSEARAASATFDSVIQATDTPGEVANQSYVLTVQMTGPAVDSSALQSSITADY